MCRGLDEDVGDEAEKAALIILNYKLHGLEHVIRKHWEHCKQPPIDAGTPAVQQIEGTHPCNLNYCAVSVVACADGGSNVLYDIIDQGDGRYVHILLNGLWRCQVSQL